MNSDIGKEIDQLWQASDGEIHELIGLASLGTESASEAKSSMVMLKTVAYSLVGDEARGELEESLKDKGKSIFDKFKEKFKEVICSDDGPYGDFCKGKIKDEKSLAAAIVAAILAISNIGTMIAVYFAILLIRAGLKTYCEL